MYIFKFPFMENTVDPHSEFKAFVLASPTITARQSFSVKPWLCWKLFHGPEISLPLPPEYYE